MAIRVRRAGGLSLELAILSCRVLCDLPTRSWPLHLHAFASDLVFELQSFPNFPLQSDVDFALALTRGQVGSTPPVVVQLYKDNR